MVHLWLVTLPKSDISEEELIGNIRHGISNTSVGALGRLLPFEMPEFSVGSLDILMGLSDDLKKIDVSIEVIFKLIFYLITLSMLIFILVN